MKTPWDHDERTPRNDIGMRAIVLARLTAAAGGIVLLIVGAAVHEFRLVVAGALALILSAGVGSRLRPNDEPEKSERGSEADVGTIEMAQEVRIGELVRLLQHWEQLEQKRGLSGFDPWAVQAVRHDIREIVDADPALERLFQRSRREA